MLYVACVGMGSQVGVFAKRLISTDANLIHLHMSDLREGGLHTTHSLTFASADLCYTHCGDIRQPALGYVSCEHSIEYTSLH